MEIQVITRIQAITIDEYRISIRYKEINLGAVYTEPSNSEKRVNSFKYEQKRPGKAGSRQF